MAFLTVTGALLVACFTLFYLYRRKKLRLFKSLGIKGPEPDFLTGNLYEFSKKDPAKALSDWRRKYGDVFGYYIGTRPVIVIAGLDDLRQIEVKDFQYFTDRPEFIGGEDKKADVSQNLVALHGSDWKRIRRLLTPTFSASKMRKMSDIMNNAIDELMKKVAQKAKNEEMFDIYEFYQELSIDVIGRTAFGIETNVQNKKDDPFLSNAKGIFSISLSNPALVMQILFPEINPFLKFIFSLIKADIGKIYADNLMQYLGKVVKVRREDPSKRRNDLLQMMLDAEASPDDNSFSADKLTATGDQEDESDNPSENKANTRSAKKQHMTDAQVRANAFLFLVAGYETTSTSLAFTTHILLQHPEAQEKIKEEIDELIDHEVLPNYDDVHKLQYLDRVFSESLRMYPPVAMFVNRVANRNYRFKEYLIPKGVQVQVPVHQLHHDPKIWGDPENFRPERFAAENKKHDVMGYQPFGIGPRNCIGMRFAQMQFKTAMSRIIRDYKLVPCEKTETDEVEILYKTVNMTPKNGIWLRAIPRH